MNLQQLPNCKILVTALEAVVGGVCVAVECGALFLKEDSQQYRIVAECLDQG
jgi:hypothetical protein